jgi:hypothetical protein
VQHCVGTEKPGAAQLDALAEKLISRAQKVGTVRRDLKASDVKTLIQSVLHSAPQKQWRSYLSVVLDGLRPH